MRPRSIAASLLALLLPSAALAGTWDIDPVHSTVGFSVRHLVGRVSGQFTKLTGTITADEKTPTKASVSATIDATSLSTQNEQRDTHLESAEFFDVAKYPEITFNTKKVVAKGKRRFQVVGDLKMHGVTKSVTLGMTYNGQAADPWGNTRAGFSATTTLNRKDFGISWNKVLDKGGAMVGDDVKVTLEIEAVLKKDK
jgi:polyisoprenoid-binding protein YceI